MTLDINAAINFLRNSMYNTTDKMARESTKPTGNNYYINSANGLYFTVLHETDISNATELLNQCVQKKSDFGKGNTTIYSMWADILHPLWLSKMKVQYAFKNTVEDNWGSLTNGDMLNNNATGSNRSSTKNKLNALCAYVTHEMISYNNTGSSTNLNNASAVWSTILSKFDDNAGGYVDAITDYREAYKQALVKICSNRFPELRAIGEYQEASGLWDGSLQDETSGGIYMRYIRGGNGDILNNGSTFCNTEATAAIIIAYR
jgi:hypothetical protein